MTQTMTTTTTVLATTEYRAAIAANRDCWVPANGGLEQPEMDRKGRRLLWCYNPKQQRHAYIDLDTDMEVLL